MAARKSSCHDREEYIADDKYMSVDDESASERMGNTDASVQEALMKGGIFGFIKTVGQFGSWEKQRRFELNVTDPSQRSVPPLSTTIEPMYDHFISNEGNCDSGHHAREVESNTIQPVNDGRSAGKSSNSSSVEKQVTNNVELKNYRKDCSAIIQASDTPVKSDSQKEKSSAGSENSVSSMLPDIVSTSTSTTSESYSVVEDISHRHERSLRDEIVTEKEEMENDDIEDVFTIHNIDSSPCSTPLKEVVEQTLIYRQFSSPHHLSAGKIESLRSSNVYKRGQSVPAKQSTSEDGNDTFGYIPQKQQNGTKESLSDLGPSLMSSKDEQEIAAKEKCLLHGGRSQSEDSPAKTKRLSYKSSQGYHTGDSKDSDIFEGCENNGPVRSDHHSNVNETCTPHNSRNGETDEEPSSSTLSVNSSECQRKSEVEKDIDSSFEIDVNAIQEHTDKENQKLCMELFPSGVKLVKVDSPQNEKSPQYSAILEAKKITDIMPRGGQVKSSHWKTSEMTKMERNPHNLFCDELLKKWDKNERNVQQGQRNKMYPGAKYQPQEGLQQEIDRAFLMFEKTDNYNKIRSLIQKGKYSLEGLKRLISDDEDILEIDGPDSTHSEPQEKVETLTKEEEIILLQLQKAKQCDDPSCEDESCKLGRVLLSTIKTCAEQSSTPSVCFTALRAIHRHAAVCSEALCTVPWCSVFQEIDTNIVDEAVTQFLNEHMNKYGTRKNSMSLTRDNVDKFIPIDEDQGYASMPENASDFEIIQQLDQSESIVVARDMKHNFRHMLIKKSRYNDETLDTIKAIKEANCLHLPCLVTHLWAAKLNFPNNFFIASHFEHRDGRGIDLRKQILRRRQSGRVISDEAKTRDVQQWLAMAYEAMTFLHTHKILYLNWRAEHLIVCVNPNDHMHYRLKLCNFNLALTKENARKHEVAEELATKLAPYLVPPEVWAEEGVTFPESDYWPFGCLVYELVTGNPLYWELRHEPIEEQRKKIREYISNGLQSLDKVGNGTRKILQQCFQRDPAKRRLELGFKEMLS